MIQEYQISPKPISFQAKRNDLIEVSEKKGLLIFVALLTVQSHDIVEQNQTEEGEFNHNLNTSYDTAIKIEVPYNNVQVDVNGNNVPLIDYIAEKVGDGEPFTINFNGSVDKELSTKIIVKNVVATLPV